MCPRGQQDGSSIATRFACALAVLGVVLALAAPAARADPVATCTSDAVVADCASWSRADVSVSCSALDSTVSGCPDQLVSAPAAGGASTTEAASCTADNGTT